MFCLHLCLLLAIDQDEFSVQTSALDGIMFFKIIFIFISFLVVWDNVIEEEETIVKEGIVTFSFGLFSPMGGFSIIHSMSFQSLYIVFTYVSLSHHFLGAKLT